MSFHTLLTLSATLIICTVSLLVNSQIIDDFSQGFPPYFPQSAQVFSNESFNNLNLKCHGSGVRFLKNGVDIVLEGGFLKNGVDIVLEGGFWKEVFAAEDEYHSLVHKALKIKYEVKETGWRTVQLYRKAPFDFLPYDMKVKFYQNLNEIIIPLESFRPFLGHPFPSDTSDSFVANMHLGHSISFNGMMTLYHIELVNESNLYNSDIPTAEIVYNAEDIYPPPIQRNYLIDDFYMVTRDQGVNNVDDLQENSEDVRTTIKAGLQPVSLSFGGKTSVIEENFKTSGRMILNNVEIWSERLAPKTECLGLTESNMFWVTYSSSSDQLKKLTLKYKLFTCNAKKTRSADIHLMFSYGKKLTIGIPITAFHGFELSYCTELIFHEPLTIHLVEVVTLKKSPFYPYSISDIDTYGPRRYLDINVCTLDADAVLENSARYPPSRVHMSKQKNKIIGIFSFPGSGHYVVPKAFRIVYTTKSDINLDLELTCGESDISPMKSSSIQIVFIAGEERKIIVPFSEFLTDEDINSEQFTLKIKGPIDIGSIAVFSPILRKAPRRVTSRYPFEVRKDNILMDAYDNVMLRDVEKLESLLDLRYLWVGTRKHLPSLKELLKLLPHEFSNPHYGLFQSIGPNNHDLEINPNSGVDSLRLSLFRFVGRIMGLAFKFSNTLHAPFSPMIHEQILNSDDVPNVVSRVDKQISAIRDGFLEIVPFKTVKVMKARELAYRIQGDKGDVSTL